MTSKGFVILIKPNGEFCKPCEDLKNILKREGIRFTEEVVSGRSAILGVPQLYKDGKYLFHGLPDIKTVKNILRKNS